MKKAIAITALLVGSIAPANADVYVKVDANGNAVGGAIMCDAVTCGAGSLYSQITLGEGERYVLQGYGYAGIGNNNPDTQVKVDIPTQTWTVTTPSTVTTFTPDTPPRPVYVAPIITETSTATTDTATVLSDTATATVETTTATSASTTLESLYEQVTALLTRILALIAKLKGQDRKMRVSFIRSIIANKKPEYHIAVVWFDKTDAEGIIDDDLSPAEWEEIAERFGQNDYLDQVASELMSELVNEVIEKRTAK